jgi:DNA repair exonuclease SbcCD nuclease subunit
VSRALFIATADLHLSENAPSFRSAEPDWYKAQRRQLRWLKELMNHLNCPLIVAGDIFDKAENNTPIVNFALDELPECYAISGNHDQPYHQYNLLWRSGYGTLVKAGKIKEADGVIKMDIDGIDVMLHGFPFETVKNGGVRRFVRHGDIDIAVVHQFCWVTPLPNGRESKLGEYHLDEYKRKLPGYDYYIFGDNHTPFDEGNATNCGQFYRRTVNDIDYQPTVCVFYEDGTRERVNVPIDEDIIREPKKKLTDIARGRMNGDFDELFESMRNAKKVVFDAEAILKDYLVSNKVNGDVEKAILNITESSNGGVRPK